MFITNRVKEMRARHNMTQENLAKAVMVTRQTIVALEKGSYTPSLMLAMLIAKEFDEQIEGIFILKEDEE